MIDHPGPAGAPAASSPRILCIGRGYAVRFAAWALTRASFEVTLAQLAATASADGPEDAPADSFPMPGPAVLLSDNELRDRLSDVDVCLTDSPYAVAALLHGGTDGQPWPPELGGLALVEIGWPGATDDANATIAALSGIGAVIGEADGTGLAPPGQMLEALVGLQASIAALAAWLGARRDGRGEHVHVNPVECMAGLSGVQAMQFLNYGRRWVRSGRTASGSGGPYPFRMFQCSDGWVVVICRSRLEWESFLAMLGDPPWSRRPEFADPLVIAAEHADEVSALVTEILTTRTVQAVVELARTHRVPLAPLRSTAEAVADPLLFSDGPAPDPLPAVTIERDRDRPRPCPWTRRRTPPLSGEVRGPLAGLRVLDLGWVWAAPMASAWLADLGADVVKVESLDRLDVARRRGLDFPAAGAAQVPRLPGHEQAWLFQACNRNKRSIRLELKSPEDRERFLALVAAADVVVESFSTGVLERLDLSPDVLLRANPGLVLVSMGGRTVDGQYLSRSYAPMMTSLAGIEAQVVDPTGEPLGQLNWGVADPNAGTWASFATVCALARDEGGAHLLVSQLRSLVNTGVAGYRAQPPRPTPLHDPEEVTVEHLRGTAQGPLGAVYRRVLAHTWAPETGERMALGSPWSFRRMPAGVRRGAPLFGSTPSDDVLGEWTSRAV